MSDILCEWLNEVVNVSVAVTPGRFANTMASGHVIGEVLHKFGYQDDFDRFLSAETSEAKLNNFKLLAPTMRLLDVPFNAPTATGIMDGTPGIANRILYQLFVALNKAKRAGTLLGQQKVDTRKARSLAAEDHHYTHHLIRSTRRQADIDFMAMEDELVRKRQANAERMKGLEVRDERRLEALRKQKIKETFERTKEVKRQRADHAAKVEAAMLAKVDAMMAPQRALEAAAAAKTTHKAKAKAVVYPRVGTPDRPMSSERLKPLDFSGNGSMAMSSGKTDIVAEIRSRRVEIEHARTQRDKRRRRALQHETDLLRRADDEKRRLLQLANVMKRSQQERRIATQLVRSRQEEDVIRENRAFRQRAHRERRRLDFAAALEREAELARHIAEENAVAVATEQKRLLELREARESARLEEVNTMVKAVVNQLVDLSTKSAALREVTAKAVPDHVFREWKELVVTGAPLYPKEKDSLPGIMAEAPDSVVALNDKDFGDYHEVRAEWKALMDRAEPAPAPADDGGEADVEAPAPIAPLALNRVLGHVLDRIATTVNPPPAPPAPPVFAPTRIRAAVIGRMFAGKSDALDIFGEKHGATVIRINALIDRAVAAYRAQLTGIQGKLESLFKDADVTNKTKGLKSGCAPDDYLDSLELSCRLNQKELRVILDELGVLATFDTDNDGTLSLAELLAAMDEDGDGLISMYEFMKATIGVLPKAADTTEEAKVVEVGAAAAEGGAAAAEEEIEEPAADAEVEVEEPAAEEEGEEAAAEASAGASTEAGASAEATPATGAEEPASGPALESTPAHVAVLVGKLKDQVNPAPSAIKAAFAEPQEPAVESATVFADFVTAKPFSDQAMQFVNDVMEGKFDEALDEPSALTFELAAKAEETGPAEAGDSLADGLPPTAPAPAPAPLAFVPVKVDALFLIGQQIVQLTSNGAPVPDTLMARLVVFAINDGNSETGWILDGFPSSVNQAKELEKVLTGRDDNWGKQNVRWTSKLAPVAADEVPADPELPPAGLDAVVVFDIENGLVIERALGRRFDPATSTTYHIDGLGFPKPPAVPEPSAEAEPEDDPAKDVVGLHARLVPVDDDANDEAQIQRRLEVWDSDANSLLAWYTEQFGNVLHIDASLGREGLATDVETMLLDVGKREELAAAVALDEQLSAEETSAEAVNEIVAEIEAQQVVEKSIADELAADDAEAARVAEEVRLAAEAEEAAAGGKKKKPAKKKKGKGGDEEQVPEGADLQDFINSEEAARQAQLVDVVVPIKAGEPGFAYASDKVLPDKELAEWLHLAWITLEDQYIESFKTACFGLRRSRDDLVVYLHQTKLDFGEFLTRPDTKQEFVTNWQQVYNEMPKDMRDDIETKAELHKRAAELQDTLWDICSARESEADKELESIKDDGYVHDHVGGITNHYITMFQSELDRYKDTTVLLTDYYTALKGDVVDEEVEEPVKLEIVNLVDTAPAEAEPIPAPADGGDTVEGIGDRPVSAPAEEIDLELTIPTMERVSSGVDGNIEQLNAVVASCLEVIPERTDPEAVRAQKAAEEAAAKEKEEKANAKGGKKPKKGKGEPEVEVLPPTQEELDAAEAAKEQQANNDLMDDELYVALCMEDSRLKTRVELIRRAAEEWIGKSWVEGDTLWSHLAVCSKHRNKAETYSVLSLVQNIKQAIEAEERLLHELVLHGQEFSINRAVYMFEPPKPPPTPTSPEEVVSATHFTIGQLDRMRDQFTAVATGNTIATQNFVTLLHGLSTVSVGSGLLPEAWLGLSVPKVASVAHTFAVGSTIDWRSFIIAGMGMPAMSEADALATAAALAEAADGGKVTLESFMAISFGFEEPAVRGTFDRSKAMKRLLFKLVAGAGSATADAVLLMLWLIRLEAPVVALRIALGMLRGAATLIGEDDDVEFEELHFVLHKGSTESLPTEKAIESNPASRESLFALWEIPGAKTAKSLFVPDVLDEPSELRTFIDRHFGPVDLLRFVV